MRSAALPPHALRRVFKQHAFCRELVADRVSAGEVTAVAEASAARAGGVKLALRTDHPVFTAFGVRGRLAVTVGQHRRTVEVASPHLAKLRRFAELCSG